MTLPESRWHRLRRRLRPVTRRVPYGHLVTAAGVYARPALPLPRPERRFVLFAQGRSGSTLLADLLNSSPEVHCDDEILTWPRRAPVRYAAACAVGHRAPVYGFKVKVYQLTDAQGMADPGAFLSRMHDHGWRIVHLRRRNVLRQALSYLVAASRDVYHQGVAGSGPAPVPIDPERLLWLAAQREGFLEQEARALRGLPHLPLVYEDHLLDPAEHQRTAARVLDYVGAAPVSVSTGLAKIADRSLERVVANHEEVAAAVAASRFAPLLEED